MPKPSYIDGMYPLIGRPKYPSLWRGCVGAWAPCLGPSGLTLFDWSPFKRHGTLTNMLPATDWVVSGGKYALDFDGSDDMVLFAATSATTTYPMTVWAWFQVNSFAGFQYVINTSKFDLDTAAAIAVQQTTGAVYYVQGNAIKSGPSVTLGRRHHVAMVFSSQTSVQCYLDGVSQTIAQPAAPMTTATYRPYLGVLESFSGFFNPLNGLIWEAGVSFRAMAAPEIRLLATRPGIAYELEEPQFDPGTNRRRRVLIGA